LLTCREKHTLDKPFPKLKKGLGNGSEAHHIFSAMHFSYSLANSESVENILKEATP